MEKRTKVWMITIVLLLLAALAAAVVFKLQLDDRTSALATADKRQAELTAELEAAKTERDETKTALETLTAAGEEEQQAKAELLEEIAQKDERIATLEAANEEFGEPAAQQAEIERMTTELNEKSTRVTELETALAQAETDGSAAIDELNAQKAALEEKLTAAESAKAELESELETLKAQAAATAAPGSEGEAQTSEEAAALKAELDGVKAELLTVKAQLDAANAELAAYKLGYEGGDGARHASAEMDGVVSVQADGLTAVYALSNNIASGNGIVFALELDGEELYVSEKLEPGAVLGEFVLNRALSAGEYEGVAVITTIAADGSAASIMRLPVAIEVAR